MTAPTHRPTISARDVVLTLRAIALTFAAIGVFIWIVSVGIARSL